MVYVMDDKKPADKAENNPKFHGGKEGNARCYISRSCRLGSWQGDINISFVTFKLTDRLRSEREQSKKTN